MASSRHLEDRCQLGEAGMSDQTCQRTVTDAPLSDVRVPIDPRTEGGLRVVQLHAAQRAQPDGGVDRGHDVVRLCQRAEGDAEGPQVLSGDAGAKRVVCVRAFDQVSQLLELAADGAPAPGRVLDEDRAPGPSSLYGAGTARRATRGVESSEQLVDHLTGGRVEPPAEVASHVHDQPRRPYGLRSGKVRHEGTSEPLEKRRVRRCKVDEVERMAVRPGDAGVLGPGTAEACQLLGRVARRHPSLRVLEEHLHVVGPDCLRALEGSEEPPSGTHLSPDQHLATVPPAVPPAAPPAVPPDRDCAAADVSDRLTRGGHLSPLVGKSREWRAPPDRGQATAGGAHPTALTTLPATLSSSINAAKCRSTKQAARRRAPRPPRPPRRPRARRPPPRPSAGEGRARPRPQRGRPRHESRRCRGP